ncbi:MAG: DNA-directed RNA polymerase subunit omega [Candidatus Sericytochromatia bacterium]|jgi:DNA-directed RNA polymerase omega subunit|nr:DNA-directed RNA polymerase subunit omega [Candidatus Tanganyikabacteria bacterium]MEB3203436.1 DNA-directed RNA polymerase subunit omega [Candidatus Sericytochromatia bacterium]
MEAHEPQTTDYSPLLQKHPNKYDLVLTVAKRAKTIKDEQKRMQSTEATKPIPLAIREMLQDDDVTIG